MKNAFLLRVFVGFELGLVFCVRAVDNNAAAQARRLSMTEGAIHTGSLDREASVLNRMASAVEDAESSHGTDPLMWRSDLSGPQGPMQISAAAAEDVGGGDRFDESMNRALGRAYLDQMHRRYGSWPDAVAAYNWGPGHMDAWISGGRPLDKFPQAVERYQIRVLVGSLRMSRRGFLWLRPRRPAPDPYNGRAAVERLYPEIIRTSGLAVR